MRAGQPVGPPSPFDREQQALAGLAVEGVVAVGHSLPDTELIDLHGAATGPSAILAALDTLES